MPPVRTLVIAFRGLHELVARNPAVLVGDLLHDRDRQTLRTLHGAHELPRLEQVTYRTGIQPRIAPPHETHIQFLSTTIPIYQ